MKTNHAILPEFQRLPSLGDLDHLRRRSLVAGWALVTVSLISALAWSLRQPAERSAGLGVLDLHRFDLFEKVIQMKLDGSPAQPR